VWSGEGLPAMHIKSSKDLATGLLFLAIGIGAYYIGSTYNMGSAQRPGTGVLPRILAWCLIGSGLMLLAQGLLREGPKLDAWAWRPLIMITLATIAFALLIDTTGLVVAMIASMTLAALGTPETRWTEFAWFMLLMLTIGIGIFILGLGMPIRVLPWN
jgi:Tripartite tricarboxylate transporter TctB family